MESSNKPIDFEQQPGLGFGTRESEAASQARFEIEFLQRILDRNPNYVDVLRRQGELLSRCGMPRRALEVDKRLVSLRPTDGLAHYNLACSLALLDNRREALEELRMAVEYGYDDLEHLEIDRDLDCLRGEPGYDAILRKLRHMLARRLPN